MALVGDYSSSEDEHADAASRNPPVQRINAAPEVETQVVSTELVPTMLMNTQQSVVSSLNNAGYSTSEMMDDSTFEIQRRNFDQLGYARSIHNHHEVVGDLERAERHNKRDITELRASKKDSRRLKKRRTKKGSTDMVDGVDAYAGPWAKYQSSGDERDEESEEEPEENEVEEKEVHPQSEEEKDEEEESTEFLGSAEFDYQGRTYMHIPTDVGINLSNDEKPSECFAPKKLIHTWKGHLHGTNRIEFFPRSNHLLLSCGNDSKIYLWSVYHKRELLRGFYGHTKPVKDINFNNNGTRFLSASYDKTVKLWNTETGECLARFPLKSVPNVVRFNPHNDNEFLTGLMNHKIEHYDIEKHECLQTYDHHLGSINSITFLENKRFMSTSEDKTARVWDIQINIPIKIISDPSLHSMPVTRVHPDGKYIAAQSMDNTILVFSAKDRYKTNKKKLFTGHNCAGFGIGIDFTPDGRSLISGDSSGHAIIWDWKTCKLVKKLKIDDRAITQVCWNTKEVSKVAFSGISGAIYYWG
jgi:pre-mRNA-processing factor 17